MIDDIDPRATRLRVDRALKTSASEKIVCCERGEHACGRVVVAAVLFRGARKKFL
jgi:hypothetical protein